MNAEPLLPADASAALAPLGSPRSARDGTLDASPSPRGADDTPSTQVGGDAAATPGAPARRAGAGGGAPGHVPPDEDDGGFDATGGAFDCNVCYDMAREPVVTLCGHLYCWPCLYR